MKECIKNLLSINRNAFRFLHDAEGFDFEKPYFIAEQPGKFTVNTVIKAVQQEISQARCKIVVLVVPVKRSGLYFATLSGGKLDGKKRDGVSYWDYCTKDRSGDIDYCWVVGDFESLRKNDTEKVFIIAQDKAHTAKPEKKSIDLSARFTLLRAHEQWSSNMSAKHIYKLELKATDGSGKKWEYEPYSTYRGNETRSADIADFIDKSGYLLRPRRYDLMNRAQWLREERRKEEASKADFTAETAELQSLIDGARRILSGSVMGCNDPAAADKLSEKMRSFSRALSYFADYRRKLTSKEYASIDRIKSDIETIKEKLNFCMNA